MREQGLETDGGRCTGGERGLETDGRKCTGGERGLETDGRKCTDGVAKLGSESAGYRSCASRALDKNRRGLGDQGGAEIGKQQRQRALWNERLGYRINTALAGEN